MVSKKDINTKLLRFIYRKFKNILLISLGVLFIYVIGLVWILNRISTLKKEIQEISKTQPSQDVVINANTVELISSNLSNLKLFLPDELNVLQTLQLIEQIGKKTKFKIETYNISYDNTEPGSLVLKSLELSGSGSMDQFFAFIKNYKFITGQILSVDSVNLTGRDKVLSVLSVNVYAYKPAIDLTTTVRNLDAKDKKILEKISNNVIKKKQLNIKDDYIASENPFK